jgi:hypothetical protein
MIGPRYVPTTKQKVFSEMDYQKHRKKLGEIVQEDRKKKAIDPEVDKRKKMNDLRVQNFKFQNFEKSQAIDKDNQLLLGRLVEISKQKKPKLFTVKSEASIPKTLNAPYRKRELERIANENEALARRLLTQNSAFSMKRLEDDYDRHRVLLKHVQKLTPSPKGKGSKLPPLSGPETAKAGNAKKIKLPERANKRSSSTEDQGTTGEQNEKQKAEAKSTEAKPETAKKETTTTVSNNVHEAIDDETEPTALNEKKADPLEKKAESGSKTNLDKKELSLPNTNPTNTILGPGEKKDNIVIPEKKDETTNNNPGEKKPNNVNTENKPKETTTSQSNIPDKKGNSANPSKAEIK